MPYCYPVCFCSCRRNGEVFIQKAASKQSKMNTRTGELFNADRETLEKMFKMNQDLIEVNPKDMTVKQSENMQVSLNDNRSKLGRQRLSAIEERKRVFGK